MKAPPETSPWWDRDTHADRRPILLARNRIQAALRAWFLDHGFVEVDPAALQVSPGNETHLHALRTEIAGADGGLREMYLHTSPEFAMKKLLAAGEERIFSFSRVWRDREGGARHGIEFTMLEWYRAQEPYTQLMQDCADILGIAAGAVGAATLRHGGLEADPNGTPKRIAVREAIKAATGVDIYPSLTDGDPDAAILKSAMAAQSLRTDAGETWSDAFSRLIVAAEDRLGEGQAVCLDHYPRAEAALSRALAKDPKLAERFELFVCGLELANGFGELTDPDEQRRRFTVEMDARERIYGHRYPIDEDFLAALAHMPPSSGIALGFDRLVMLATGAPRISDVQWAPMATVP